MIGAPAVLSAAAVRQVLPVAVQACKCALRSMQDCRASSTVGEPCTCLEPQLESPQPVAAAAGAATERRPTFHLAPPSGWINDPNGPLLYNNTYHLFYQHVPNSSEWQWGLVWGHARSQDLVHWEHLPVALAPTPGSLDQHGCFSGCATVDGDGRPYLLYTGVIRKAPDEIVPGVSPQHEAQLLAVADELGDLKHWRKVPGSFLPHPPTDMDLTGWRDPFVLERPSADSPWWYVMVGAGVRDTCGTALVYRSTELTAGWEYVGPLCESPASFMWECPIMAHLSNTAPSQQVHQQQQQRLQRHMFAVSPDYCVNMVQYYLGSYAQGRFDLQGADGPFPLDLGASMYAPNVLTDKQGRTVLFSWMQERQHLRPPGTYNSSCCLCVPRALYLSPDGTTLMQEPLPELQALRQPGSAWHIGSAAASGAAPVLLPPGQPLRLGAGSAAFCSSSSIDVELQLAKGDAQSVALLLHPFDGVAGAAGAAITYCWDTNTLQVINATDAATVEHAAAMTPTPRPHYRQPGPDPAEVAAAEAAAAAQVGLPVRCGGVLRDSPSSSPSTAAGEIRLRVLLDGSCLEVFTSTGEALSTRVYRADEAPARPQHLSTPQHSAEAALGMDPEAAAALAAEAAAGAVGWEQLFSEGPERTDGGAGGGLSDGRLELVSFGPGAATLLSGSAWQMSSMWQREQEQQGLEAAMAAVAPAAAAAALHMPASLAVTVAAASEVLQGLVVAEAAAVAAALTVAPAVLPVSELSVDLGVSGEALGASEPLPLSPLGNNGSVVPVQTRA